jgi:hypothetical protein
MEINFFGILKEKYQETQKVGIVGFLYYFSSFGVVFSVACCDLNAIPCVVVYEVCGEGLNPRMVKEE